jgi:hypothetical protein
LGLEDLVAPLYQEHLVDQHCLLILEVLEVPEAPLRLERLVDQHCLLIPVVLVGHVVLMLPVDQHCLLIPEVLVVLVVPLHLERLEALNYQLVLELLVALLVLKDHQILVLLRVLNSKMHSDLLDLLGAGKLGGAVTYHDVIRVL